MCDRKLGFFFLSCDSRNLLSNYDSMPYTSYTTSEKIFCLGLRRSDFLLDLNSLRFSLHLTDSVAREFQKTKRIVLFLILFM